MASSDVKVVVEIGPAEAVASLLGGLRALVERGDGSAAAVAGLLEIFNAANPTIQSTSQPRTAELEAVTAERDDLHERAEHYQSERDILWDATGIGRDRTAEFVAGGIRQMVDSARVTRTQLRPQLARAEADAAAARTELEQLRAEQEIARCRVCGCTDEQACDGGCWWVKDPRGMGDLCSTCLPDAEAPAQLERLRAEVDRIADWVYRHTLHDWAGTQAEVHERLRTVLAGTRRPAKPDDAPAQEPMCEHGMPWKGMRNEHYAMYHKEDHP